MQPAFRLWLEERYPKEVASSRRSNVERVEAAYGPLEYMDASARSELLHVDLFYSSADKQARKPNPSKIEINGDIYSGLMTLKSAANLYIEFLRSGARSPEIADESAPLIAERPLTFALEADLQQTLRSHIECLESGLRISDGGSERSVSTGFIDITAEDRNGAIVVIELKAGKAGRDTVGQIQSYMGALLKEEHGKRIRGIIVAADFDHKIQAAASFSGIELKKYSFSFTFEDCHHVTF